MSKPSFSNTLTKWANSLPILVSYTIAFIVVAAIAFAPLLIYGKSFLNYTDGLPQQFVSFIDVGQTVREMLAEVFGGGGVSLPWYDLSIGYGASRSYPFDPLVYVSVFVPEGYTEAAFNAIVVFRLWLAGAATLPLSRSLGVRNGWRVIVALLYAFGSCGLNSFLQVQFVNQVIAFPLVVWSALLLLNKGTPWWHITVCAATCLINGIYTLYMMELMVAVYIVVRFVVDREKPLVWVKTLLFFAITIAVALVISAPTVFPAIQGFLSIDRLSVAYDKPSLYSPLYYQRMFAGFLKMYFAERDWFFGYGALALICCAFLFGERGDRKLRILRALLIVGTVFLCVPLFGSMFNGFSYVANRWVFGFALLIACITGFAGQKLFNGASKKSLAVVAAVLVVYTVLMALLPEARGKAAWLQLAIAWVLLAIAAWAFMKSTGDFGGVRSSAPKVAVAFITVIALGMNVFLFLAPAGSNWQNRLVPAGEAYARVAEQTPARMAADESDELVRYDRSVSLFSSISTIGLSTSRISNAYGIDFYRSLYDNDVDRFHAQLGLAESGVPSFYCTLDGRAALLQVLGVGYYAAPSDDAMPLAYGVNPDPVDSIDTYANGVVELFEVEQASRMAIVFDGAISAEDYQALSPLQKQEALLQGVVLEGLADGDGLDVSITSKPLDFKVVDVGEGVSIDDGDVVVSKGGATIGLSVEGAANVETYLYVEGLGFAPFSPRECYDDERWAALSESEQAKVMSADRTWTQPGTIGIEVESDFSRGVLYVQTPYSHLYGGKDTWLWNVGYSEESPSRIVVRFQQPGVYSFSDFQVLAQPQETLDAAKTAFSSTPVSNLSYSNDSIACDVLADDGQYLLFSVPYSDNWSATVNGEPVDVLKADTAFMAVKLSEGPCHVKLSCDSSMPLLYLIGVVSALMTCAVWFMRRRWVARKSAL